MAGLQFTAKPAAEVALVAATPKTVLTVTAPSNHRDKLGGFGISFDGTVAGNEPVVVELMRFTGGTGTGTTVTPTKVDDSIAEAIQSTSKSNYSAEPTAGEILDVKEIHPQTGYEKYYPFGWEKIIGGGDMMGIRCTAPQAVNCYPFMDCEE